MFIIIGRVLIIHSKKKLDNLKNEKHQEQKKRAKGILKTLISIVSVMIMFGLSWFFGALSIGEGAIVFQWLFVIFNTTQGFMLFLFFCVIGEDARNEWKILLTCNKYRRKKSLTAPLSSMSGNSHANHKIPQRRKQLDSESGDTGLTSYGNSYGFGHSNSTIRRSVERTLEKEDGKIPLDVVELSPGYESTTFDEKLLRLYGTECIDEKEAETSLIIENGDTIDGNRTTEKPKKSRQLPPHVYIKLKRPTYKVEKITYDDADGLQEKVDLSSKRYNDNVETHSQETNDIVFSNNTQDSLIDSIARDLEPATQTSLLDAVVLSNGSTFSQEQVQMVEQHNVANFPHNEHTNDSSQCALLPEDAEHLTFM